MTFRPNPTLAKSNQAVTEFCYATTKRGSSWFGGPLSPARAAGLHGEGWAPHEARPVTVGPGAAGSAMDRATLFRVSNERTLRSAAGAGMDAENAGRGVDRAESTATSIIQAVDVDGDGFLDLFEITKAIMGRPHLLKAIGLGAASTETQILMTFQTADEDSSGSISKEELVKFLRNLCGDGTQRPNLLEPAHVFARGEGVFGKPRAPKPDGLGFLAPDYTSFGADPATKRQIARPSTGFSKTDACRHEFFSSGSTPAISRDGMKNTDHFFRVTKDKPGHNNFASHNIPRQTVRGDRYFNRTDQATPQDTYGITAVRRQHSLTSMR